uniref:Cytochrome c oxidase subunit 3 n=2 Tax=cassini group TaxID=254006 RepID=A0A482DRT3_9HEMI|nr:cytochrome c oxidase subunit III [Magicicada cassinii]QBM08996.1 cytochrome c oxidase subunit III [Magicicada tredecassini]AWV83476.1 cytochrome oxidase subunit III [Magicicada cassinii]QBM08593.1 cytochrome c oxidase subunit III [Magicicada cassinii]QBM08606.1 cytochrome c oxidase subunit III [Magicicada cassinii]QBM08892.1 cytochrome c oxidase subunit III [Magicicada cassinii]
MNNHPYHLVDCSPWPLTGSIGAMTFVSGMVMMFHMQNFILLFFGFLILILTMIQWWRDVSREGTFMGLHTMIVVSGLKLGMILFIVSEIFFFISFFWGFFHSSLSPVMEIGMSWPPFGIMPFNPMQIPLLNTMILLCSGVTITWAHHSMMESKYNESIYGILLTLMLGMYFTILQMYEYFESSFCISDSVYGSTFFVSTGFHGIHVIIGSTFIMICLLRQLKFHFSSIHHFGFEAAAWYWHFVDIVWLFLYVSIYWWGS